MSRLADLLQRNRESEPEGAAIPAINRQKNSKNSKNSRGQKPENIISLAEQRHRKRLEAMQEQIAEAPGQDYYLGPADEATYRDQGLVLVPIAKRVEGGNIYFEMTIDAERWDALTFAQVLGGIIEGGQ